MVGENASQKYSQWLANKVDIQRHNLMPADRLGGGVLDRKQTATGVDPRGRRSNKECINTLCALRRAPECGEWIEGQLYQSERGKP